MMPGEFSGSRFGAHIDLETSTWQRHFEELRGFSNEYHMAAERLGVWPPDYPWPRDSLHRNTRIWEYPFAADAIERFGKTGGDVLDVGSGLTFFPAFLAARGYRVVASDNDPRVPVWAEHLWGALPMEPFGASRPARLRFEDLDLVALDAAPASFDIVTCISVLEHLPVDSLDAAIDGLARIMKPGGVLVTTFDCCVRGKGEPGHEPLRQTRFRDLLAGLSDRFSAAEPEVPRVACDLITNIQYPHEIAMQSPFFRSPAPPPPLAGIRSRLGRLRRGEAERLEWCAYGITFERR